MTGTGTQSSPYIPGSYAEFKSAIGTSGAYVRMPENTVYDLDELENGGHVDKLTFRCRALEGNNMTIRNGNIDMLIYTDSGLPLDISLVHFANFVITGSSNGAVYRQDASANELCQLTIADCSFVGNIASSGDLFSGNNDAANKYYSIKRCYFGLKGSPVSHERWLVNMNGVYGYYSVRIFEVAHCVFDLSIPNMTTNTGLSRLKASDCLFKGDFQALSISDDSANTVSLLSGAHNGGSRTCFTTSSQVSGNWQSVTDEQVRDAGYLSSRGLPIIVPAEE